MLSALNLANQKSKVKKNISSAKEQKDNDHKDD
jgi:hypothetical protein